MKFLLLLIIPVLAFAQNIPSDQVKIGRPQTSDDKELIFDTNDGVSNKKLSVEKTTKKLKWDGNSVQIGDGAATDKEIIINGTSGKALKYDSTNTQFEFNDDLGINGFGLKTNTIIPFSGTETSLEQNGRVKGHLHIGTGPNRLRVSGGNLEFTNDGTIFKKIGSGSGGGEGGLNLALNPSFEDGAGNWTATGGTYSVLPYTVPSENNLSYARFVASGAGQTLCSDAVIVPDFLTGGCVAYSEYKTTDNNAFELQVLSASAVINKSSLVTTEGKWLRSVAVPILCPTAGQNIQVCYNSLAAGTIEVDQVYKGSENRVVQTSDAGLVGGVIISGCSFTNTSTSFSDLSTVSGSCVYTPFGKALAPTGSLPALRFPKLNAGEYIVEYTGAVTSGRTGGTTASVEFRAFDGLDASRDIGSVAATTSADNAWSTSPSISFSIPILADKSNVTISIQGRTSNPSFATPRINANQQGNVQGVIRVYYVPSSTQSAVTNDQSAWFIDANIGGANPDLGTGNISTYTEITHPSLDLVLNSGSASAQIPCSATNSPTGLTCAVGSESVGVSFTPPYSGYFDVCGYFSHHLNQGIPGGQTSTVTFQWIETGVNNQTILQQGKTRTIGGVGYSGEPQAQTGVLPFANCGTFLFTDTSTKVLRLMREQALPNQIFTNIIQADRDANNGQRDIRVTVRPSTMNIARPVLTGDTVTTPNASKPIVRSAKISAAGLVTDETGEWITGSCTIANPVSTCAITGFSSSPNCTFSHIGEDLLNLMTKAGASTATQLRFVTQLSAANTWQAIPTTVICHGIGQ